MTDTTVETNIAPNMRAECLRQTRQRVIHYRPIIARLKAEVVDLEILLAQDCNDVLELERLLSEED